MKAGLCTHILLCSVHKDFTCLKAVMICAKSLVVFISLYSLLFLVSFRGCFRHFFIFHFFLCCVCVFLMTLQFLSENCFLKQSATSFRL